MPIINRFPQIAANLRPVVSQLVRKAAFDIAANAASGAAVDTGFMKNSIYVVTSGDSTYGGGGTPPGDSFLLPEVAAPSDDLSAIVACGANYSVYIEMGTRFMAAQPFFFPAVDQGAAAFASVASAFESLLGAV